MRSKHAGTIYLFEIVPPFIYLPNLKSPPITVGSCQSALCKLTEMICIYVRHPKSKLFGLLVLLYQISQLLYYDQLVMAIFMVK